MRVVTASQMAAIDRETIAAGTPGLELMRRAGRAITDALDAGGWLDELGPVLIVCGKGNNGGDGLVIAQLLSEAGLAVHVLLLADRDALSPDAQACYDSLSRQVAVHGAGPDQWPDRLGDLAQGCTLVIDAVFGTGIVPPLRPEHAALCRALNALDQPLVAVDIPSGVCGDDGAADPDAVRADATITVGLPKLGLLLPPGRDHVGELQVVDIGFADAVIARHAGPVHVLSLPEYQALLPARPSDLHKYMAGCLLLVAGSRSYGGAAHLAGLGALRSGAGMVSLAAPVSLETALRVGLPEAILRPLAQTDAGTIAPVDATVLAALLQRQDAVAVGPGLGADPDTDRWLCDLVASLDRPLVLDADGLSAFARQGRKLRLATDQAVLTPHAGELARLTGLEPADIAARRLDLVPELAARWRAVLLLKGSPTMIGLPDGRLFINPSGDDTLARGGTGDILTGLIGGLLAQGCPAADAALLGALVQGLAGELAATHHGRRGVLTREIAAAVAPVLASLAGDEIRSENP
jgi:ADP-dependent NAD(P)H-hydrate dehydratase / NAD(P)H-hydrate epimerase